MVFHDAELPEKARQPPRPFLRTLGGQRRYLAAAIRQLAEGLQVQPTA